ncbi:MAG: protein TolR [Immundisolibacter sp.]|uniref:protein TolR n=1 Tax=Immundisolibacter sp. TaxID=1934948 RepID=UPI003D0DC9EA
MAQVSGRRRRGRVVAEINVVPYIDVMLVLLIIFMITTPLLEQGVEVDLPQAKGQAVEQDKQTPITVTVDRDGKLYFDAKNYRSEKDKPEDAKHIVALAKEAMKRAPQAPVLVRGHEEVPYQAVIQAMSLLKEAGAPKVGLVTEIAD